MTSTLTRDLAWAAATDVGNRSMRKAGRQHWTLSDYQLACDTFAELWPEPADEQESELERDRRLR